MCQKCINSLQFSGFYSKDEAQKQTDKRAIDDHNKTGHLSPAAVDAYKRQK